MNTYMIYRKPTPEEGAFLVFAHTAREARKVGWSWVCDLMDAEFVDVAVSRIWKAKWLFDEANKDKMSQDKAHVIDNPISCKDCYLWGHSPIGKDGLCDDCRGILEEDAIAESLAPENP